MVYVSTPARASKIGMLSEIAPPVIGPEWAAGDQLGAIDAASLTGGTGDVDFVKSEVATMHLSDRPVADHLSDAPVRSLFQQDLLAVCIGLRATWDMRRTAASVICDPITAW